MTNPSKLALASALMLVFIVAAIAGGPSDPAELALMREMAALRASWPGFTAMVAGLTYLGGAYVTISLVCAATLWLLLRRAPARALLLSLCVIAERSLVEGLKDLIGRPRPHFQVDWLPHSLAFPSGHAANSMTAFVATALIAAPPDLRRTAAIAGIAVSVLVGFTRVYLGVHWPTDVIGGWAFGLLAVLAAAAIGQRSGSLRVEPEHQIVGRHVPALDQDEPA
jgi:undecaprenyl-diphosphatase